MREWWRDTPGALRAAVLVSLAGGTAALALGWWADSTGFWTDRPFVTNVFSSVTAALFGIPLALVVLQRVGVAQTEAVEARAARRLAARVLADLVDAARPPCPSPDIGAAAAALRELWLQLETGAELAEAIGLLDGLVADAAAVLVPAGPASGGAGPRE